MNYIISLGGSLIVPGEIDTKFVKKFARMIVKELARRHRFFIVTGGGATARKYIRALKKLGSHIPPEDLDWIGIAATRMNAQFLSSIFGRHARRHLITDPSERKTDLKKINLVSGWKPGWSTDYVAVRLAQTYGSRTVVNLSNIDYVYDADPRINKKAKKFERMTWREYQKQFGTKWDPGANFPFDPVADKLAKKLKLPVVVMNGARLKNFQNFLKGKKFVGTTIGV